MLTHATATTRCTPSAAMAPVLCRDLHEDTSERILELGTPHSLSAQEALFWEGDDAGDIFEVVEGLVRLLRLLPDGRRALVGFLFPGDLAGLCLNGRHVYTAEAVTDCRLRRYNRRQFQALLEQAPDLRQRMFALLSDELTAAQDQMLLLARKTADEKVASFLLWIARKTRGARASAIELRMGRADIADFLGLTVETVSRTISRLKRDGLICLTGAHEVRLLRRDALESLAEDGHAVAPHPVERRNRARWPI